jgi:serine carboxypeptidase-like clade 1
LRKALYIPDYAPTWNICWDNTHSYQITNEASAWIYPILKANGIRLMFYSGDTDGALPTYGTKRWIKRLGWNIKNVWRPWLTDGQVSGYIEQYEGLDFITVKGTGHMAPQWKRPQVTQMITRWIHGEAV